MFGDDMPRHTSDGIKIQNGMSLFNTKDNEPVILTTGQTCRKHGNGYRRPDSDGVTRADKSIHADGSIRYVNVWEGFWHAVGPMSVCRYVHASELRTEA